MQGKVALVTGSSSGIGTAIVQRLANGGFAVTAAGRNTERIAELQSRLPGLHCWTGDLAASAACNELVTACVSRFGRLDLLVNNAGIYLRANAETTTDQAWLDTIAINLSTPFFLSRAALPHLRKTRGIILNIASDWGLVGGRNAVAYCASKGGLVLMSKAMAVDHAADGIRINAICPGDVATPMLYREGAARGLDAEAAIRQAADSSLTGRVTMPDEVAALVAFLATDESAQITGAAIPIDGGNTAA